MRFETFIALRYLLALRGRAFISITAVLSIIGVTLGVGALIIIMAVMTGFTTDLREKILGVASHVVIKSMNRTNMDSPEVLDAIREVPGVTAATPYVQTGIMLSNASGSKGSVLRGIDVDSAPQVLTVLTKIEQGSLADLKDPEGLPGIVVGTSLAASLGLDLGSRVNVLMPTGERSAAGFTPKIKQFRVVGIFNLGLHEYDSGLCFISLQHARDLMGLPPGYAEGVEVSVVDIDKADVVADGIAKRLGPPYYTDTWMSMYAGFFAALKLEKSAMAVILTLIVLVGAFSIITSLVMLVMEKTREIAVLMSMGASSGMIRRIFMLQGSLIGLAGTVLGLGLGLFGCWLLSRYQFIELPKGVYSLDHLPVLLQPFDVIATCVCALLLCFLATLYPASTAARLEPVEAMRRE